MQLAYVQLFSDALDAGQEVWNLRVASPCLTLLRGFKGDTFLYYTLDKFVQANAGGSL
jgi:hypothetical protein